MPWRRSKKLPRTPEGDPHQARRRRRARSPVAGRGACRTEEQDRPAMGQTRHAPVSAQGPAHDLGLYLRSDLPEERQGGRPCHAPGRHACDECASRRDRPRNRPRRARRCHPRPGRMAHLLQARSPPQHHPDGAPAPSAGTQPGREHLAVHARQLALKPRSSKATKTSSITAAKLGTNSPNSQLVSPLSEHENGPIGSKQRPLV